MDIRGIPSTLDECSPRCLPWMACLHRRHLSHVLQPSVTHSSQRKGFSSRFSPHLCNLKSMCRFYSVLMQIFSDYVLGGRHLTLCLKPIPCKCKQNNEAFFSESNRIYLYISTLLQLRETSVISRF